MIDAKMTRKESSFEYAVVPCGSTFLARSVTMSSKLAHDGSYKVAGFKTVVHQISTVPDTAHLGVAAGHMIDRLRDIVRALDSGPALPVVAAWAPWALDADAGVDVCLADDTTRAHGGPVSRTLARPSRRCARRVPLASSPRRPARGLKSSFVVHLSAIAPVIQSAPPESVTARYQIVPRKPAIRRPKKIRSPWEPRPCGSAGTACCPTDRSTRVK